MILFLAFALVLLGPVFGDYERPPEADDLLMVGAYLLVGMSFSTDRICAAIRERR